MGRNLNFLKNSKLNRKYSVGEKMLKRILVLLVAALVLPSISFAGSDNPWDKKLPFKKATINYVLSGLENGTETLYIKDYGRTTAKYHKGTMKMMGMTTMSETIEFIDPEWIYTFDLTENTGTKSVNPEKYMIEEYNKLSKSEQKQVIKNSEAMATGPMMEGLNAKVEKNAKKIMGYDCDKMTMMGSTIYTIHETPIALLTESNMMGMVIKIEATDIKKGSPPKNVFKHPESITPEMDPQADAMARSMAKQTMDMLKDPEAMKKASSSKPMQQSPNQQQISPEEQQQMEKAMEALKGIFGN